MASEQGRFLQHEQRRGWIGCWGGLSCFSSGGGGGGSGGGKRIVPSRLAEGMMIPNGQQQQQQQGGPFLLLAPPSSPASALQSTGESPSSCVLLLSHGEELETLSSSSTMFVTGPYAHETQLVSPPVFSTFTTEPSTAPLTPPPELTTAPAAAAHLAAAPAAAAPSSPDVPFARFLSTPPDDVNFFCPATFAQFYGADSWVSAGRLSISRDSADAIAGSRHHHHPRHRHRSSPSSSQEEEDAYRASFGFSPNDIIPPPFGRNAIGMTSDGDDDHNDGGPASSSLFTILPHPPAAAEPAPPSSRSVRKIIVGLSASDTEIDYRRSTNW